MSEINEELFSKLYDQWRFIYSGEKGVLQVDTQVGMRQTAEGWEQAQLCNFHCDTHHNGELTGGKYKCPAAAFDPANTGTKLSTLTPADTLVSLISTYVKGVELAHSRFMTDYFDDYCRVAKIPFVAKDRIRLLIAGKGVVRVNLFGGNSEVHREILKIIHELLNLGVKVDWTTVGAKIFLEERFLEQLFFSPPTTICMSLDEADSPEQLRSYFEMSTDELKKAYQQTPVVWGQRRKLIAAIGAARKLRDTRFPTTILFNNVVHQGNIGWINELEEIIHYYIPSAMINFYFAQTAFENKEGIWTREQVIQCEEFVDYMIENTVALSRPWLTTRLHFWLAMKAIFVAYEGQYELIRDALCGHHVWDCFTGPSFAGQIGGTYPDKLVTINAPVVELTGNCFWNADTVNNGSLLATPEEVRGYLLSGRVALAKKAESKKKCGGCTFPRLMDDEIGMVFGLRAAILNVYLALRDKYVFRF